jgi:hypothetical protein
MSWCDIITTGDGAIAVTAGRTTSTDLTAVTGRITAGAKAVVYVVLVVFTVRTVSTGNDETYRLVVRYETTRLL